MNRIWDSFKKTPIVIVLTIVLCCLISTSIEAKKAGLFYNASFVDIREGDLFAEASNLNATLEYLDYEVIPFQNLSDLESLEFDIVIIPELEKQGLLIDEFWHQIPALKSYIENGGGLIIMGIVSTMESNNRNATDLMNRILGSQLKAGEPVITGSCVKNENLPPEFFPSAPDVINNNNAVVYLQEGFVNGTKVIYQNADKRNEAAVAQFPLGDGSIVYFGWGWWNAFPIGNQDGGWVNLLKITIENLACKAPTVQIDSKYVFNLNEQASLSLSSDEFSHVVEACTEVQIDLSKSEFDCEDVGKIQTITLIVTDKLDRSIEVDVLIEITDINEKCALTPQGTVMAGKVQSPSGTPLKDVLVNLSAEEALQLVSDESGVISIGATLIGEYTAQFQKESTIAKAISSNDLAMLNAHLLGVRKFTSPYQYIAADMNGDGLLSVIDEVIMKKLILHTLEVDEALAPNWQFISAEYKFTENLSPLSQNWDILQGSVIDLEKENLDVIAIKLGDLDFSID